MARTLLLATAGMTALTLGTFAAAQRAQRRPADVGPSRQPNDELRCRLLRPICAAHGARHRAARPRLSARSWRHPDRQGSVDVRGFAGTAGNVVINGSRPSTKAETIDVTLSRSRPAGHPGRIRARRPLRLGLCWQKPGPECHSIAAGGHRRPSHRVGQALVHRLREHRHPGIRFDPPRDHHLQPLRRHRPKPAAGGRHRRPDRLRDRRAGSSTAASTTAISTRTRSSPRAGHWNAAPTRLSASMRAGSRAASTCSRAIACRRRLAASTTTI